MIRRGVLIGILLLASGATALGSPVATYNYAMTDFAENAGGTAIYATVPGQNSIAVVNPSTLQSTLIPIGSDPTGLALSADGNTLYIADNGSTDIAVFNTQTQTLETPLSLGPGVNPLDVQIGSGNRLWVLTGEQNQADTLIQIDATTAASTGPQPVGTWGGRIRTSPDGNTLYYANFGLTPNTADQINVSTTTSSVTWSRTDLFDGNDVALSRDGSLFSFPESGSASNEIYRASDDSVLGTIGPATNLAFSADNRYAYSSVFINPGISIEDLSDFQSAGTIDTVGHPQELFVDDTGGYVFSDEVGDTQVYATGLATPEPSTALLLSLLGLPLCARRRKRAMGR